MKITSFVFACLAAAPSVAALDGRFVFGGPGALTISRMDPIVAEGKVGGHVHHVFGGSTFRSRFLIGVAPCHQPLTP